MQQYARTLVKTQLVLRPSNCTCCHLQEGDLVTGVVESIRIYGAFVKVGSIKCLLHKSNIGQDEVTDIADHLSKRQKITARVVTVNEENVRVSLSIKPEHLAS
jgi:ribosomal protein S1